MDIGVDTGGTFTDLICRRDGYADVVLKVPSTPSEPSKAVMTGVKQILDTVGGEVGAVRRFVHGTTVATNVVLERKGAESGLITTSGFADVLEIGRQMRTHIYELELEPETPVFLAPGARRTEVIERISSEGEILKPLNEASLGKAIETLRAEGVTSIAVCLLFSFLNPTHERRVRDIIETDYPDMSVSLSSDVDPAFREYERTVVTAFDAYTKPVLRDYLAELKSALFESGVVAPLQVMQSRGGISAAETATKRPVRLFLSGPAAGVIGGSGAGQAAGSNDLITVDIGGTSCDIALVASGRPLIRPEGRIAGYPVRVPMVDVNAMGSGGGSIAWLDAAGGLRVGPQSAGADPGPACYGRHGKVATVTDASIVLGFLNPDYFAGGSVSLDKELAKKAIGETIALPLSMTVEQAALGIHRVVNAQMAEGMRQVSIRQGHDPRDFSLVPLGGAGPVHAIPLAEELNIDTVIVPRNPGVLSAEGLLVAPIEHEMSVGFPRDLDAVEIDQLKAIYEKLDMQCTDLMNAEVKGVEEIEIIHAADICYVGQSHYLDITVNLSDAKLRDSIYRDFIGTHAQVFGYSTESPARIVNLRSIHRSRIREVNVPIALKTVGDDPLKGRRLVVFDVDHATDVDILDRACLSIGDCVEGPAIIEQADTTTVLHAGWVATVLESGELVLKKGITS
ncbi:MAG: hydantoinase/oxoprolinase family protein [Arenicellales bacterium]|nr:hydantoinase/oxoprolinase family protein [Arenicellales bacterium]